MIFHHDKRAITQTAGQKPEILPVSSISGESLRWLALREFANSWSHMRKVLSQSASLALRYLPEEFVRDLIRPIIGYGILRMGYRRTTFPRACLRQKKIHRAADTRSF
jgi:hypothetical protein